MSVEKASHAGERRERVDTFFVGARASAALQLRADLRRRRYDTFFSALSPCALNANTFPGLTTVFAARITWYKPRRCGLGLHCLTLMCHQAMTPAQWAMGPVWRLAALSFTSQRADVTKPQVSSTYHLAF